MRGILLLTTMLVFATGDAIAGIACDFNNDGVCDCADIDALFADIAAGNGALVFDLNADGAVDLNDLPEWLSVAGLSNTGNPFGPGDVNLDGLVNAVDFTIWQINQGLNNVGYCRGDLNGDGIVDIRDRAIICTDAAPGVCSSVPTESPSWGIVKGTFVRNTR